MGRPFSELGLTSFLVLILALVLKINGHPYEWPEALDHRNTKLSSLVKDASDNYGSVISLSQNNGKGKNNHMNDPNWEKIDGKNDGSENIRYKSGRGVEESENGMTDSRHRRDLLDDKNPSGMSQEEITELINEAFREKIFLTPNEIDSRRQNHMNATNGDTVMNKKIRSPSDPHNTVVQPEAVNRDSIIFPENRRNLSSDSALFKPVPSCENSTFCVNPPYYPSEDEINRALSLRYFHPISEPSTIAQRIGDVDDDNGLCVSNDETITPMTARDMNNEWHYIVNTNTYVQSLRVQVCQSPNGVCNIINDLLDGYETSCKQKYIYHEMVALGPNGTYQGNFHMPTSCCCHVKLTGDMLLRFGGNIKKNKSQSSVQNTTEN